MRYSAMKKRKLLDATAWRGSFHSFACMPATVSLWAWWQPSEFIRATDQARAISVAVFLLSMATVVMWLTVRIGKGLRHRKLFMVMSCLFASSGFAV